MGLLDIPRGLISRLPVIGGSSEPEKDEPDEVEEPDEVDKPDEPDEAEPAETEDAPDEPATEDEPEEKEAEDEPDDDSPQASEDDDSPEASGGDSVDISDTTAPSIGPETVIEKEDPEKRLARHEQSDTDAMGLDKRREVIGNAGGASVGKQLVRWTVVACVIVAAAFGAKLLVDDLDKPPKHNEAQAPWAGSEQAPQPLE